ncbi:16S rRNA (cytosine1402-N4)-methyltransferase [Acetoanaerobium noterae]|uniref:Ribosomal RNA small subunit methyltransferase H n=1 Tax=Acetoanaerobium noterae TaxID=745369 RepID=A0A1T5A239_9FIRM|nr:16S rRNA (cytosine(1402)-N(4))-methyltransferase RsmH [Acetoanaerobium noterae]SKB29062.1 16S rRNA (cytosine1402-N4)-methyltransferase [Acetoanaerobium noterae]
MEFKHVTVLLNEAVDILDIKPEGIYVDGTLGGAGHSLEIVKKLTSGKLICFDQDINAISAAKEKLKDFMDKTILVHSNFENLREELNKLGIESIDGFLVDLGVSSHQLDVPERGFSYMQDAPLDMRMDNNAELSAYDVVNTYSEAELKRVIKDYGEENWSARIAKLIVERRATMPIRTTFELVDAIKAAIPKKMRDENQHPAKRTFQAIRIEVNRELDVIEKTLLAAVDMMDEGGVLAVITFHSLEDRIVKNVFKKLQYSCTCPPEFPVCICNSKQVVEIITRKPILPSENEVEMNPRSRSAKLRAARKL